MTPADACKQFLASCIPGQDISAVLAGFAAGRPIPADPIARPINDAFRPLDAAAPIKKFAKRAPRRYQRSPDREASRRRRRELARDGHMPPDVRSRYTEGEAAVLRIVAGEVRLKGYCDWPIDKIAALAGVCRTTCQNAMREAIWLRHASIERRPVKGRKSDTNIVRIISREWLAWIQHRPAIGFKTPLPLRNLSPTKIKIHLNRGAVPVERQYGCRLESG